MTAAQEMRASIRELMELLGWQDFEMLVDLVFSTSGWRRQGTVGKTQKTLDLDLVLPSTDERVFVQVKSRTTSAELAQYVGGLDDLGPYSRMFYVYHSGEAQRSVSTTLRQVSSEFSVDLALSRWLVWVD